MANTIKIKNSGTASAVPSSLEHGELGLNYADGKIYFKNSSNVIVDYGTVIGAGGAGASVTISDTAPSGAGVGDIWYESDTGKMFVYYDSFWVEASGSDGQTGSTGPAGPTGLTGPTGIAIQSTAPADTNILWADTSVTGVAVVPAGGTTGQVLSKASNTNYDAAWANAITSSDLALKANIASPTFTGIVTIPAGASISGFAPLANAALTGTPTAPTASAGTNTTQIATMASRPWNTAWGMLTYATATTNDLTITGEELQITGSSFTAVTGRLYRITYYEPELYGATSYMQVNVRDNSISGSIRQLHYVQINGNNNLPSHLIWIGTLTAGTINFVATLSSYSGTGAAYRAANQVAYLAVEDIGPA